jgi:cleavage and polyadenylation specificity factor subunit 1
MGLEYVFSFLDDDGVFSKSREQHWTHLRALSAILAANGLALNLEKCEFAISEMDFLGHRISAAGDDPLRDNVQVILDFSKPDDCKALKDSWV